jgi:leucyl aminopeptidase
MSFKFEYQAKVELEKVNLVLYKEMQELTNYLNTEQIESLPKDDNCLFFNDFKSQTVFVKLETEQEKNRRLGFAAFSKINSLKAKKINALGVFDASFFEAFMLSSYRFDILKTKPNSLEISLLIDQKWKVKCLEISKICHSVFWTRDLVNLPFNYLNTTNFESAIKKRFEDTSVNIEFWDKNKLQKENFGGLLAVNQASNIEPRLAILEYKPENSTNEKPIVLVGKGVVYDTGGLSLKPTEHSMDFMKCDMAGAAAVLGLIDAAQKLHLDKWIVCICPITDNLIGNQSFAPGNILTMRNQMTVEVMDTDAEGRLILADALDFAKTFNPALVIDLATLTGSAVRALGENVAAIMGNAPSYLFHQLAKIGEETGEKVARLPFWDEYKEQLKSDIADIKNLGGATAGAITAGKFLEYFVAYDWIHIDIAGPAFTHKTYHYQGLGGTGFGVRLLVDLIRNYTGNVKGS